MYQVKSISNQLTRFHIINNGKLREVELLPGNFVFTDDLTNQIRNLELNKIIRTREVDSKSQFKRTATQAPIKETKVEQKFEPKAEIKQKPSAGKTTPVVEEKVEDSSK